MKVTTIGLIVILGLAATALAAEDDHDLKALELGKCNSTPLLSISFIISKTSTHSQLIKSSCNIFQQYIVLHCISISTYL